MESDNAEMLIPEAIVMVIGTETVSPTSPVAEPKLVTMLELEVNTVICPLVVGILLGAEMVLLGSTVNRRVTTLSQPH